MPKINQSRSIYMMKTRLSLLLFAAVTLFSSFSLWAEPSNLTLVKKDIISYHDSGAYEKELTAVITQAQQFIHQEIKKQPNSGKFALVLDIDETSLSNYKHMIRRDFTANKAEIHKEIIAADAPAIKPMLNLYNDALKHGIKVFFVTGRSTDEGQATEKNLKEAGYRNWSGLYLRPTTYKEPSIIPFKSQARAQIAQQGYVIIASIGDQFSDIRGGYAKKGFKLPNPYYYLP